MKKYALILSLCALPAFAQEVEEKPADKLMRFLDRFSIETQEFLGLMAEEFGPAIETLRERIEDWSYYEKPEMLPNGDIIIRRKPDHPVEVENKSVTEL